MKNAHKSGRGIDVNSSHNFQHASTYRNRRADNCNLQCTCAPAYLYHHPQCIVSNLPWLCNRVAYNCDLPCNEATPERLSATKSATRRWKLIALLTVDELPWNIECAVLPSYRPNSRFTNLVASFSLEAHTGELYDTGLDALESQSCLCRIRLSRCNAAVSRLWRRSSTLRARM